jgi:hypothetical protein
MNALRQVTKRSLWASMAIVAMLAAGCAGMSGKAPIQLTGGQEVPPLGGNASGTSDITIILAACPGGASARCPETVGKVTTSGIVATVAHIHRGKAGQNGPVILPLVKRDENTWVVPDRAYISDSDYGGYQNGELYINVHSANNPNGEIRGQLVP